MPKVSEFYGIKIIFNYRGEHNPPHFHATYGEMEALIQISPAGLMQGSLPPRLAGMVIEWTLLHQEVLLKNWTLAREQKPLIQIEGLP